MKLKTSFKIVYKFMYVFNRVLFVTTGIKYHKKAYYNQTKIFLRYNRVRYRYKRV